jgi:hypothetical protein
MMQIAKEICPDAETFDDILDTLTGSKPHQLSNSDVRKIKKIFENLKYDEAKITEFINKAKEKNDSDPSETLTKQKAYTLLVGEETKEEEKAPKLRNRDLKVNLSAED